eukprot:scaffold91219_cov50-Attheya_sp.AAC.1
MVPQSPPTNTWPVLTFNTVMSETPSYCFPTGPPPFPNNDTDQFFRQAPKGFLDMVQNLTVPWVPPVNSRVVLFVPPELLRVPPPTRKTSDDCPSSFPKDELLFADPSHNL